MMTNGFVVLDQSTEDQLPPMVIIFDFDAERICDEQRPIVLLVDGEEHPYDARIYGDFAVHLPYLTGPIPEDIPAVTVSHLPTQSPIVTFGKKDPNDLILMVENVIANVEKIGKENNLDYSTPKGGYLLSQLMEAYKTERITYEDTCDCPSCQLRRLFQKALQKQ